MPLLVAGCGRIGFGTDAIQDGGETDDGSTDSGPSCTFCDDFDRVTPVDATWTTFVASGGTAQLSNAASVSSPSSLLVDVAFPISGVVYLRKDLPMATISAKVSVDLTLDQVGSTGDGDIVQLGWVTLPPPCTGLAMILIAAGGDMQLQETYVNCGGLVYTNTPLGGAGFHHVQLEVDLDPSRRVRVLVDGVVRVDKPIAVPMPPSQLNLNVGFPYISGITQPWAIRYDNVRVDLQ
jgi:hypothetical protein